MNLQIDDELLKAMDVTEEDVRIELFARLFDLGRLSFGVAAGMAGVSPERMEQELRTRGIPRYRYTHEDFDRDLQSLETLRDEGFFGGKQA
jgi:predicted HTH domain antitoxin